MSSSAAPPVSIGIPVYNGERYLAESAACFLAQTFGDFELIICDNASTDRTEEIGREIAARDARVRYVRNPVNIGSARNYRRAFELARGKYFRWNAADDLAGPEAVERGVEVLDREPSVVLAYPKTRFIDEDGRVVRDYDDGLHTMQDRPSDRFMHVMSHIGFCNALYGLVRSDVLRRTRLLGTFIGSDVVFHAELSLYGKFWEIPEPLFFRRFHAEASSSKDATQLQEFYDPGRRKRVQLREWRHLYEYYRAVLRAPIAVGEKGRLAALLARGAVRSRESYAAELSVATRRLLGRALS